MLDRRERDEIELRFDGEGHRIDFHAVVGRDVSLYPRHEVLKDLIAARLAGGQDLRFEVEATSAEDDVERAAINATAVLVCSSGLDSYASACDRHVKCVLCVLAIETSWRPCVLASSFHGSEQLDDYNQVNGVRG